MQGVARAVGVRAPSLYKHVDSRGALIKLITESVVGDLGRVLEGSVNGEDPGQDLHALARAFRAFARRHPESYRLIFAPMPEKSVPDTEVLMAGSDAVLRTAEALAGNENALEAARLVTAWIYGFMTMELAGVFRIEGDLDEAFEFAVSRLSTALSSP